MEIHNFMKKKIIYAPPILEIFVMGAEANFCVSTPVNWSNPGMGYATHNDLSDYGFGGGPEDE